MPLLAFLCLLAVGCGDNGSSVQTGTQPAGDSTSADGVVDGAADGATGGATGGVGDLVDGAAVDRTMRVLLHDGVRTASFAVTEPFHVVDPQSGEVLLVEQPPSDVTATFGSDHIDLSSSSFHTTLAMLDIVPLGDKPIEVRFEREWRDLRGAIRLVRRPDGGAVINLIDMEDYLVGVVAAELPANFSPEMFRVQAVVARTYAWYARQTTGRRRDWDVWSNERSQVYGGLERQKLVPQAAEAVRGTRGIVLTWSSPQGEKIFCTYYSSRCGGVTAPAVSLGSTEPIGPLAGGVRCEPCLRENPRWPSRPRIGKLEIARRLADKYERFSSMGAVDTLAVLETDAAGRVLRLGWADERGESYDLDGENFRLTVDPSGRVLRSAWFTLVDEGDAVAFVGGRGMGHGKGLCQHGAEAMARAGNDAGTILLHYFPGAHLTRAY